MRALFTVIAKICGLLFFYSGLISLVHLAAAVWHPTSFSTENTVVFYYVIAANISFGFSYLFIFQIEKLASFLKIPDENINIDGAFSDTTLRASITLMGLYIFTTKIGLFISDVYHRIMMLKSYPHITYKPYSNQTTTVEILASSIVIILAVYFIFQSHKVVEFIKKFEKQVSKTDT